MWSIRLASAVIVVALSLPGARAQPAVDGYFIARSACPAPRAIRGGDNPGDVRLEVDRAYRLLAQNKVPGTHYWIAVPGATPERRWVEISCGTRVAEVGDVPVVGEGETEPAAEAAAAEARGPASGPAAGGSTSNLLAVSWQPAFCETRPSKPECESQTESRFDASNFALHGLWPQPRGKEYCGVSGEVKALDESPTWSRLPMPDLEPDTRADLDRVMPGTQSSLDRHEWIRHGTCYGSAEEYFAESILLMDALNASPVRELLASRIGRTVTAEEIRAAFDEGFGKGAGERVRIACTKDGRRQLIGEITIGLSGDITPDSDVGQLILAARPTKAGCPSGEVDRVGLQ